ncbi:RES domain-containing protein [Rhizobium leguminosarum bv. viciae]|nr:RES domain-containing protein [Rhizobium leguminosarum bv. viciae]
MELDDPEKPEFASWDSYSHFARSVRHKRRYVWTAEEAAFLDTVRATNHDRDVELPFGMILFRAQRGIDWDIRTDDDGNELGEEPVGYGASRMKPRLNQAVEGRANPAGIPVLYLGTTEQTAISEVRPWVGASVSVAQFKILRALRAIDLSRGHGKSSISEVGLRHFLEKTPIDAATKEKAVWIDIDNAFSRPVTVSDDAADYVPTQILSELFRDIGYDAIVYKSQFGEKGFNVVLFNPDDADVINCAPYEVASIEVSFKEIGNRWFATKHLKPKSTE